MSTTSALHPRNFKWPFPLERFHPVDVAVYQQNKYLREVLQMIQNGLQQPGEQGRWLTVTRRHHLSFLSRLTPSPRCRFPAGGHFRSGVIGLQSVQGGSSSESLTHLSLTAASASSPSTHWLLLLYFLPRFLYVCKAHGRRSQVISAISFPRAASQSEHAGCVCLVTEIRAV